ncbi:ANR family transcriptional regulator [Salmonella enterica]|nr:ANR family transcriptional regulator [Salmonella enterica]EIS9026379.1 ANR family transcriptional regulator [Salmonella enterica]EJE5273427.1 ANR family transcriptional regulator [Salmonella enterica]ELB8008988.1 ANR family transcriptional regulator [Salmonella enterica]
MADVSDYARSTYRCYAVGAARRERDGEYLEAAELWLKASERPCKSRARKWAEDRADFCRRAATGRWSKPDECERV